jgi:hypothetical protein
VNPRDHERNSPPTAKGAAGLGRDLPVLRSRSRSQNRVGFCARPKQHSSASLSGPALVCHTSQIILPWRTYASHRSLGSRSAWSSTGRSPQGSKSCVSYMALAISPAFWKMTLGRQQRMGLSRNRWVSWFSHPAIVAQLGENVSSTDLAFPLTSLFDVTCQLSSDTCRYARRFSNFSNFSKMTHGCLSPL